MEEGYPDILRRVATMLRFFKLMNESKALEELTFYLEDNGLLVKDDLK